MTTAAAGGIDAVRQTLLAEQYRNVCRELNVYYIWGETGVGKTRYVMDKYGYENVFRVTNYAHPFDGYNCESVILCRYGDKVACFTKIYVVSNIPMEKQYPNIQSDEPRTWKAWLRRFDGNIVRLEKRCC